MNNNFTSIESKPLKILAISIFIFTVCFVIFIMSQSKSMDYGIYTAAVQVYEEGDNPYNGFLMYDKLEHWFPFRYPPITLPFFQIITKVNQHIIYGVLLLMIFMFVKIYDEGFQPWLFFALMTGGFFATFKNFTTGNIGIVSMLFIALLYYFMIDKKYFFVGITIGVFAIFKTVPIVYLAVLLFIDDTLFKRLTYICVGIATFLGLHALSFLIYPEYSVTFYNLVINGYPVIDAANFFNPSMYSILQNIISGNALYIIYIACIISIGLFLLYTLHKTKLTDIQKISLVILATMLVLPELKHYSYTIAAIPVYFLIKGFGEMEKYWSVMTVCTLPMLVDLLYYLVGPEYLKDTIYYFIRSFIPYFTLLIIFVLISLKYMKGGVMYERLIDHNTNAQRS